MQVGKCSIYTLAALAFDLEVLFTEGKDAWKTAAKRSDDVVFYPKITKDGLRDRQIAIILVPFVIGVIGAAILTLAGLTGALLGGFSPSIAAVLGVGFSLLFLAIGLCVRAMIASVDEIRLRLWLRKGEEISQFKISKHAYIRWYDFAILLILSVLLVSLFSQTI